MWNPLAEPNCKPYLCLLTTMINCPPAKKVKLCVVGPKCSGKTALVRVLAGSAWEPDHRYTPTVGVRIQEIPKELPDRVTLELWDCSGDDKFEACRPAMANNVQGLIMVYNASVPKQKQELDKWYQDFAVAKKLPDSACQIFGINTGLDNPKGSGMEGKLASLPHVVLSMKDPNSSQQLSRVLDHLLKHMQ